MLNEIVELSQFFMKERNRSFSRYFFSEHRLTNRFSIIIGQRGIGKTTAIIQHILNVCNQDYHSPEILYVQSDHILVSRKSLYDIAEEFYKLGGKLICFDEIHQFPQWSAELKSINDTLPKLKIIASGSSALEIQKGSHDLSRRAIVYKMHGMSFREFIGIRHDIHFDPFSLTEMIKNQVTITENIVTFLENKNLKVLALFRDYLEFGFYPYFLEYDDKKLFFTTLEQNIHTTLERDLPAIHQTLNGASIQKIRKLLSHISTLVPFIPDLKKLKTLVDIGDERTLKTYLKYLEDAGVILSLSKSGKGLQTLEKPEKIYLNNPNLYYGLAVNLPANTGTIRETFFLNMLFSKHKVSSTQKGDFIIDDTIIFEIGGKQKDFHQIKNLKHSYLAVDNIEHGSGKRIPLWLFGFLY